MEQEIPQELIQPKIPSSPHGSKKLLFTIIAIVVVLIVGISTFYFFSKSQKKEVDDTTVRETVPQQQEVLTKNKAIYFGRSSLGEYSLVNVQTGEVQSFIPAGYTLLDELSYQMFPTFLILQKEDSLYVYNVESKSISNISSLSDNLKLKKNERVSIHPSITEKDKFIINIDKVDSSQVSDFNGLSPVVSTRVYSFDASTNTFATVPTKKIDGCFVYDSKYQRFFSWSCGEQTGSNPSLSIHSLKGNVQSQVITAADFGISNDGLVHIEFENGLFFASGGEKDAKILVLDPTQTVPTKEVYTTTGDIGSKISNTSIYSINIDRDTNTLIIGSGSYILLLRFDTNKQITQSTYISEKGVYANFVFSNRGKLYYQTNDAIRVVDLTSWQVEKSIPSSGNFSEITLFAF